MGRLISTTSTMGVARSRAMRLPCRCPRPSPYVTQQWRVRTAMEQWRGRWTRVSFPTQTGTLTLHQVRPSKTSRLGCTASATATVHCHAPRSRQHLLVSCSCLMYLLIAHADVALMEAAWKRADA